MAHGLLPYMPAFLEFILLHIILSLVQSCSRMLARMLPGAQPLRGTYAGLPSSLTADPSILNMKRDFKQYLSSRTREKAKWGAMLPAAIHL